MKRPFWTFIGSSPYHVTDEESRRRLSADLRTMYEGRQPGAISELREGESAGKRFFEFAFMGRSFRIYFRNEQRKDTKVVVKSYFLDQPYRELDVKGKTVLNIGASIGDSAIYFASRGAQRVISLEPYPATFEVAKLNIEENGFQKQVLLLNEGAGRSGVMKLDSGLLSTRTSPAKNTSEGIPIRFSSLGELMERFSLRNAILKVNCEGCERELLLGSDEQVISCFEQVAIEYHGNPKAIAKRVKRAGFHVRVLTRGFGAFPGAPNSKREYGFIYARRSVSRDSR